MYILHVLYIELDIDVVFPAPDTCGFKEDAEGSYRGFVNFTEVGPCPYHDYEYRHAYVWVENYCRNRDDHKANVHCGPGETDCNIPTCGELADEV